MNVESKSATIPLEGGPLNGALFPRPEKQHATCSAIFYRLVDSDGVVLPEPERGIALYQYFEEHDCAFWDSNVW